MRLFCCIIGIRIARPVYLRIPFSWNTQCLNIICSISKTITITSVCFGIRNWKLAGIIKPAGNTRESIWLTYQLIVSKPTEKFLLNPNKARLPSIPQRPEMAHCPGVDNSRSQWAYLMDLVGKPTSAPNCGYTYSHAYQRFFLEHRAICDNLVRLNSERAPFFFLWRSMRHDPKSSSVKTWFQRAHCLVIIRKQFRFFGWIRNQHFCGISPLQWVANFKWCQSRARVPEGLYASVP